MTIFIVFKQIRRWWR